MIEELRIRDLGVIVDTTLKLGPGFTAITGETGAGKTMVVTALGLLMGERSDAGAVRSGAAQARVNGIIHTDDAEVSQLVADAGGDLDDGELYLGRTVSSEGRSRASIGGAAAPVGRLGALAERLFTVHGQSDQLRLRNAGAQRDTVDRFGGAALLDTLQEFQRVHRERRELAREVEELTGARDDRQAEAERLRFALTEISDVDPKPGEEEELAARIALLSNVEELRSATASAHGRLVAESDDPMVRDAATLIDEARQHLERVTGHDPKLAPLLELLTAASIQVSDVARELAAYASDLDEDGPGELARTNERLAAVRRLFQAYGATTDEVIAYAESAAVRVAELDGDDEQIAQMQQRLDDLADTEDRLATDLSDRRRSASATLSEHVTRELTHLALPDAQFVAQVDDAELGAHGRDEIRFMLAPHPGAPLRALAKSASGGELSRVMLALEVVVADADPVPTFVFDEVDAGVGGAAAIEIGRRLATLARTSQVIVVTHLAQVAAFANNHVQVVKDSAGGFTESSCLRLDGDARAAEMARLLSGLSDSASALEHAEELLAMGRTR